MNTDILAMLATLVATLVLPWLAEYLNNVWRLDGPKALSLVTALSALVAIGGLVLSGDFTAANLNLENFVATFGAVFSGTQIVFQVFKDFLGWNKPPTG